MAKRNRINRQYLKLVIFFFLLLPVFDVPADVSLNVFLDGNSNVIFRILNFSSNTIRLPSAGYTPLAEYTPGNTNAARAVLRKPTVTAGIWLSDAIESGTNERPPSVGAWLDSLKIKTLKPWETLNVVCDPEPWKDLDLASTNIITHFEFNIPPEYGRQYHMWSGDLSDSGPIETFDLREEIPAGIGGAGCDLAQLLDIYDRLTDAEVTMQDGLNTNEAFIKTGPYPNMTRGQAIGYVEKMLHDQAGLVFRHSGNHVEITLPKMDKH